MKSRIEGVLVALGTPPDSDQPRALVHCTEAQIQRVERACMMSPVTIIETAELRSLETDLAESQIGSSQASSSANCLVRENGALSETLTEIANCLERGSTPTAHGFDTVTLVMAMRDCISIARRAASPAPVELAPV